MAVKVVGHGALGTSYGMGTHVARNMKMFSGYFNFSGNSYAAGGITCTLPMKNVWYVSIEPKIITGTNIFYGYNQSTNLITMYTIRSESAAATAFEVAAATNVGALTSVYCFAIGRD